MQMRRWQKAVMFAEVNRLQHIIAYHRIAALLIIGLRRCFTFSFLSNAFDHASCAMTNVRDDIPGAMANFPGDVAGCMAYGSSCFLKLGTRDQACRK